MTTTKRIALVTGGMGGLGEAICIKLAKLGYVVATTYSPGNSKSVEWLKGMKDDHGYSFHAYACDVTDWASCVACVAKITKELGPVDVLVNNAGIFFTKPFTEYTADDFRSLVSTNVEGFLYITQLCVRQMLVRKSGGSIVTITAALAANPIVGVNASVPMITKGGLDTITRHLALEYAKDGIRFNAVAPGVVDTPLHNKAPKEALRSLNPMGILSDVKDIVDAVMYLTESPSVTGHILYVDGGAHSGRW